MDLQQIKKFAQLF